MRIPVTALRRIRTPLVHQKKWPTYIDATVDWAFDFGDMQLFGEYQAPMGKPIDAAIVGLITDANDTSVLDKIKSDVTFTFESVSRTSRSTS